jgi:hypothetical protein
VLDAADASARESLVWSVCATVRRERAEAERDRRQAEGRERWQRERAEAAVGQLERLGRELLRAAEDIRAGRGVAAKLYNLEMQLAVLRRTL